MSIQDHEEYPPTAVAVIGMAGRFPGSPNVDAFWQNLRDAREGITFFSDDEMRAEGVSEELLARPNYIKARGAVDGVDKFDASFFNYRARDAELMDPQIRFFLETSWEAMESSGYDFTEFKGSVGVYAGASSPSYFFHHYIKDKSVFEGSGGWHVSMLTENDFLTTHVSFRMRIRGPSMCVQTACSTSLVCVHVATQAVLNGECDMAVAGGVSIGVPSRRGYVYDEGHILSPDGHCRPFDADARGTIEGEGVGVVILKRLDRAVEDGDNILAVILATAVNNDGENKAGYTAPSVSGQAEVITEAMAVAGVDPSTITYVEAHGTGTAIGDPIELAALKEAFVGADSEAVDQAWCAVGAVKSNVGHLDAAAGVTGFIKAVQAVRHGEIPPTLHFRQPNPKLAIEGSPFYIADRLKKWEVPGGGPRRAGVSAFGIGGTNAHAVLQQAPPREASPPGRPVSLVILSTRTQRALERATDNLADWLEKNPDASLQDVAFTLQAGRRPHKQRRSFLARTVPEAIQLLRSRDPERVRTDVDPIRPTPVIYLFPGAGVQHVGMTKEVYDNEPVYREHLDRACELFRPHLGLDLRDVLFPAPGREEWAAETLFQTAITQPALFAIEYAIAKMWAHFRAPAEGLVGFSIGEYAAACIAGVMTLEDAVELVTARAALMQEMPAGGMLSVSLSEGEVRAILPAELDLCTINGPASCVVGGESGAVDAFAAHLEASEVHYTRVHTSHVSHSRMMDPILERFEAVVRKFTLRPNAIPFVSNVTGTWITEAQAMDPKYWVQHLRGTVRFDDCLRTLFQEPNRILLECGPGRALATLARRHPQREARQMVLNSLPGLRDGVTEEEQVWQTVADLWHVGIEPEWDRLYDGWRRLRVGLPTYPWDHGRYWLGVRDQETLEEHEYVSGHTQGPPDFAPPRNAYEAGIVDIFKELFGVDRVGIYSNFFHMGGDSLLAVQLAKRIRERWGVQIPLKSLWEIRTLTEVASLVGRAAEPGWEPAPFEPAEAELAGASA
jgi:phthiocerol/phenolphthiocerol synthesis type-I polyketide synthase E